MTFPLLTPAPAPLSAGARPFALPSTPGGTSAPPSLAGDTLQLGPASEPQAGSGLLERYSPYVRNFITWFTRFVATPPIRIAPVLPPAPSPADASLREALAAAPTGRPLALGARAYAMSNFDNNLIGLDVPATKPGITGLGIDKTVLRLAPGSSSRASEVPTAPGTTNQLSLVRVTGSPELRDFTLQATEQGHLYNGLRLSRATGARITNVKVSGVPGNHHAPPGETFGINDYASTGSIYRQVEVDGRGLGATGLGTNSSRDVTIERCNFHDNRYGAGAAFWQTHNLTISDTRSTNNRMGLNFERVSGTVNVVRPVLSGNEKFDFYIGSDRGSATYTIVDPQFTGPKLRILVPDTYRGGLNTQRRSDIRVFVNGVDRTADLVQFYD